MKNIFFTLTLLLLCGYSADASAASSSTLPAKAGSQTTEEIVREYFADIPVMIEIARCESKFRQFTDSGNVLRGGAGGQMVGVFQFFDRYHLEPAADLGFDIETVEGNLAYARHIYTVEGTDPWNSALDCWAESDPFEISDDIDTDEILRQKIALLEQIVTLLQILIANQESSVVG
jgi:hypothetical protein